jgi:uncharacterized protein (UPF0335 family)
MKIREMEEKENHQRLTDSPEFKRWFGNSKVVDSSGKPLVVYHGTMVRQMRDGSTMGDVTVFDRLFTTRFRKQSGDTVGSWFSTNPGSGGAEMYSGTDQGSTIYPVYLSIQNPLVTTFQLMTRRARLLANGKDDGRMIGKEEVDAFRKWLKQTGKDGVKIEGSGNEGSTEFDNQIAWIALEPTQIKSAIGNNGKFDPNNPSIVEARINHPDVEYEVDSTTVTAKLRSYKSQSYTKLASKVERISQLESELKTLKEEVKQETRENVSELFDAEDAAHTRVVQTMSFILTLSKDPKPTVSPKYKEILDALSEKLTPELIVVLEELKKQMVTVTQKSPSLKIKQINESFFSDLLTRTKKAVLRWGRNYDAKLQHLKNFAKTA